MERLKGLSHLVLDCLRLEPHPTHFNLDQALRTVEELKPRKTTLTHLGHDFDYSRWLKKLPKDVFLAYDGLTIRGP
jgi:phosphoribosyl 1,2-cyclic phosphate phosphodiesterase